MNKKLFLLFLLIVTGCSSVPLPPDMNLSGVIMINGLQNTGTIEGLFNIESEKKELTIFFSDEYQVPMGKIKLKKRKILENSTSFKKENLEALKYWTFIFNNGNQNTIASNGLELNYKSFSEVNGRSLPSCVEVSFLENKLDIEVIYGNIGTGKD